jgi:pre-mRNA-splicing factor 18
MDFASLMAKEISKAKSPSTPASGADNKKAPSSEKKYVRRADLEAERIAAYNEEQERLRNEREEKAARKRKLEEEEADQKREREEKKRRLADESKRRREAEEEAVERERRKKLGLPELPLPSSSSRDSETPPVEGGEDMEDERLVEMLRGMGEPARLFGESHKGRLRRYRRLVQRSLTPQQLSKGPIPTTLELVPEKDMRVPKKPPKDAEGRKFLFRQLASYFSMVLEEWEIALAKRDLHVKQTFAGKQAYNAMIQSRENMKPLFAKFERGEVDDTVLEAIVDIVNCAQERRYVDANDGYLRLSIGKA